MKALTVRDLLKFCLEETQKGHGNYTVFVTDDEEANGYHALWYTGQSVSDMTSDARQEVESINCDLSVLDNKDEAIYIG